jgi:hypothetical protein
LSLKSIGVGAIAGAAGGALIAPEGQGKSSILQGAGWGAFSGGPAKGVANLVARAVEKKPGLGKAFVHGVKEVTNKEALTGAAAVTGVTAVTNKLTGAYSPDKKNQHRIIQAVAPAADDMAMLGLAIMQGLRK